MKKFLKKLIEIAFPLLIFVLLFFQAVSTEGMESKIYLVGFLIYGEVFCLHLDVKAMRNAKEKQRESS